MPETHINAHKARVAELRQQASVLTGEADQLQELIDSQEPAEASVVEITESVVADESEVKVRDSKGHFTKKGKK